MLKSNAPKNSYNVSNNQKEQETLKLKNVSSYLSCLNKKLQGKMVVAMEEVVVMEEAAAMAIEALVVMVVVEVVMAAAEAAMGVVEVVTVVVVAAAATVVAVAAATEIEWEEVEAVEAAAELTTEQTSLFSRKEREIKITLSSLAIWTIILIKERFRRCLNSKACDQHQSESSMMILVSPKVRLLSILTIQTLPKQLVNSMDRN